MGKINEFVSHGNKNITSSSLSEFLKYKFNWIDDINMLYENDSSGCLDLPRGNQSNNYYLIKDNERWCISV